MPAYGTSTRSLAPLLLAFGLIAGGPAAAATTTLHVGDKVERARLLQPGVHRYLRYIVKDGARNTIDIWSREVRIDRVNGKPVLRITQRWDAVSAKVYTRLQDSSFDADTFRPLTHRNDVLRDGVWKRSAFRFLPDKVIGDSALADNAHKDFIAAMPEPAYNFETDMELLQTLPLAAGYEANIPFYDPGLNPPARYVFKVAGEATLTGPDGATIECWLVTADYNQPGQISRYWFAKRNQVLVRNETPLPDGSVLIKTLLPPEVGDVTR